MTYPSLIVMKQIADFIELAIESFHRLMHPDREQVARKIENDTGCSVKDLIALVSAIDELLDEHGQPRPARR